jgi:hypothetical protein
VTDIRTCETFTGNIVVAASAPEVISLDGIRTIISGNIDVEGVPKLRALSSESLQTVSSFTLNNLPELSTLNFPSLTNFSSLKWFNLPTLQVSTVASGKIEGEIQELTISNTSLRNLDWFKWPVQSQLNITLNAYLHSFSIPNTDIGQSTKYTISDNPSLESLKLEKLNKIDGALTVTDNNRIKSLSAPALETINGDVILDGDFENVTLSALDSVSGSLILASSSEISSACNEISSRDFADNVKCSSGASAQLTETESTPTDPDSPVFTKPSSTDDDNDDDRDSDTGNGGISSGTKIGLAIAAVALTVVVLVAAFFYFRRRSRAKVREIERAPSIKRPGSDSSASIELEPKELAAGADSWRTSTPELQAVVPQELDAGHGRSELGLGIARPENVAMSPVGSVRSFRSDVPLIRHELPG